MAIEFATDEWIKALRVELNNSQDYAQAAKKWEGDFYFVVEESPGVPEEVYLYMDLWHGECRDAYKVDDPDAESPAFIMRAPISAWRKVIEKELDPIRGLMTRQLKLKGNMMKIVKMPKAATELVECCTRIDTRWPGET